jgi:hypothetical protein
MNKIYKYKKIKFKNNKNKNNFLFFVHLAKNKKKIIKFFIFLKNFVSKIVF